MLKIIKSPAQYIQGEGLIGDLGTFVKRIGVKKAYLLTDAFIAEHYQDTILAGAKDVNPHFEVFKGECSKVEVDRNRKILEEGGYDVILGIGGGKTLDTAKAIGYYSNLPVVIVPTIASTDAPCSALSVLYTEKGEFDEYLFLTSSPAMVIMDTDLIVKAPARLFVSGMGDALATYFEAETTMHAGKTTIAGGHVSKTAMALAELCFETLLEDGYKAKLAVEHHMCTTAVENIIEANTYLSGIGFESGGLAAAHAIHNGFTVLEECHHLYHGEKVAFGTLVQLVLENRPMELIDTVVGFCQSVGLPTTLAEIGAGSVSVDRLRAVAEASVAPGETIHNANRTITADDVLAAILTADSIGRDLQ